MSEPIAYMRPDWVILGVDNGAEGVFLIASSEMTEAELRVVEGLDLEDDRWPPDPTRFYRSRIDYIVMSANMKTYVWVRGATYADALRTLFERWEPKASARPAVGPQPGLPSGR